MKYKFPLFAVLIAFGVTLAIVIGERLSAEAMAVVVGVIAGVAASIPTSLIIVWVATRSATAARQVVSAPAPAPAPEPEPALAPAPAPRIVVMQQPQPPMPQLPVYAPGYAHPAAAYLQPGAPAFAPAYAPAYANAPTFAHPHSQRTFTMIGGEVLESSTQPLWEG